MKNKCLSGILAFLFSSLAYATTTTLPTVVEPGNELDFFSQLVDVFVLKTIGVTENVGIFVLAFVAFCILCSVALVILLIAGFILKNKK
jgi:hypothetical protein